jgi:wyosine [tRNA(Phe)-imidazoG37] synthetase (radical SAM superfamily)
MPTQEERLEIVEYGLKQFKTETIKAYGETAMELTMVKGLTEDAVKRLASLKTQIDQRFDTLNQQITDGKQDILDLHVKFDQQKDLLLQILARLPEKS